MQQQTLTQPFSFAGIGIHTGTQSRVTVYPAPEGSGRVFQIGTVRIPAQTVFVTDTRRCTTLGNGAARVHMVEHLLSALMGCKIDNALIVVDGHELPILDGSAQPIVELIRRGGVTPQAAPARCVRPDEEIRYADAGSEVQIAPASDFAAEVTVAFDEWPEGSASLGIDFGAEGVEKYVTQVATARTFAFQHEVDALLAAGLAKGGSLDNALIISPPGTFSTPLRLPAEWAAHKLLDLIGDFALLDARPQCRVRILRPGHRVNTRAAERLRIHGFPDHQAA